MILIARPKKNGKRATGIQSKKGFLYIVTTKSITKNGIKKIERKWHATGLKDTPENIKKASQLRTKILEDLQSNNTPTIDKNISVSDYLDYILEKKKREIADTTYCNYLYRSKKIKDYFGLTKVKSINESLIATFFDDLFLQDNVQPRTVKDIKVFFSSVMDHAVKDGIIVNNPIPNVEVNKNLAATFAKNKLSDNQFFSYDEAMLFLNRAKDHELYELFYVTLFFGLRREEVLGLKWSAIDFNGQRMKINHTVTKGISINRTNTTKTESSNREYPLSDEQINMFKKLKQQENRNRKLFKNDYYDSDYVFKHVDGSLYYPDYPTKAFGKIIKSTPELPQDITFHGLRKSCVSILVHEGLDVKSIQKWVGHADINTTLKIYAIVKDQTAKKEVSEAMKNIIHLKDYR